MSTDYHALCARMADELDHYRQLLMDDRRETHTLATEARAALAQPEPVAPTDEELISPIMWMIDECVYDNDKGEIAQSLRELIARWGTPAIQPVPVAERLPGPEDCDAEGRCWWHRYTPTKEWHLQRLRTGQYNHWLPHWALPVPTLVNNIREEN